jgi:tRNA1Val (adenine37-N6)-methyltransferase
MSTFKLKQFELKQTDSLQKMGSDSMLLGASIKGEYKSILDVGTGTGILALMMAQKNEMANIFAIEPHLASFEEAKFNFENSSFSERFSIENCMLQEFNTEQKFDLIISNPPYFENSTLGDNVIRNTARHTLNLSIKDFYEYNSNLLSEQGHLTLIFPADLLKIHLDLAKQFQLFPIKNIAVVKDNNKPIRHIITYSFIKPESIIEDSITIALSNGKYSDDYIALTKDFYTHDLSTKQTARNQPKKK